MGLNGKWRDSESGRGRGSRADLTRALGRGVRVGALVLGAAAAWPGIAAAATEQTLWASPAGSGSACTQSAPCSLSTAQSTVETLTPSMTGDVVVNLYDGTYPLTSTLSFGPADSGSNGYNVIWQAAPGATPVLSGGTEITGWTQSQYPGIWQANVGTGIDFRQLYVDGQRMPRAGGPLPVTLTQTSTGYTASSSVMSTWRNPSDIELDYRYADRQWTNSRCPIQSISGATITMAQPCWGNLTATSSAPYFGPGGGTPYWVDNAFELLDNPGQWYLDQSAGVVYYMPLPGQNMTSATVIAPTLQTLVSVRGSLTDPAHNIEFSGLSFEYGTWLTPGTSVGFAEMQANFTITGSAGDGEQGACDGSPTSTCPQGAWTETPGNVVLDAASDVTISNCVFTHLGGAGLNLIDGTNSVTVSGNEFDDISGSGIQIGSDDDPNPANSRETVSNVTVQDNYIHDIGAEYQGAVGIFDGYTQNVTMTHNTLDSLPYSGISIGWGGWWLGQPGFSLGNVSENNTISDNDIGNVMESLSDGGAVYSNGYRGTSFANGDQYDSNFFHGNDHPTGWTLYDDIGSNWITASNDVMWSAATDTWGGCDPEGNIDLTGSFRTPDDAFDAPCGTGGAPITNTSDTSLAASDPGASCEAIANCGDVLATAGVQGSAASIVDNSASYLVDDQSSAITYSGTSWVSDTTRSYADIDHTLHYTTNNGDSASFTFTGVGIDYIAEANTDRGGVDVYIDGTKVASASCASPQLFEPTYDCYQVRGLSPGIHTIKLVKTGGTYMSVDAFRVYPGGDGEMLNDTDPSISYSGAGWTYQSGRSDGEYQNDVHYTGENGDSYTVTFTGTGLDLIGDKDPYRGVISVQVDGGTPVEVNDYMSQLASQQLLFSVRGLAEGAHTVTVTKVSGTYMDLDAVAVYGWRELNDTDPSISYSGSWSYQNNRGYGEYDDDVHVTSQDGASTTLTFTGSGVDVIDDVDSNRGAVNVSVDGVPRGQIYMYSPTLAVQQTVFSVRGLGYGTHTITLTKDGGTYLTVDAFKVYN